MVSITVHLNFDYALFFIFCPLWQALIENGARSELSLIGYGAIAAPFCFWLGWGYFWHIAGDALTYGGVPLLSPLSSRKYSLKLCRTNSLKELFLAVALLLYVVVFGFQLLPEQTKVGFQVLLRGVTKK